MSKVKVGYYIDHEIQRRLKLLANEDRRTVSAELSWLVEQERRRRERNRPFLDGLSPAGALPNRS